jgi:hypothetical protein
VTATIVATLQPTNVPPRVQLAVTGSPGSVITITRTGPDGAPHAVRTAEPAPLIAGAWTGYDYESPFDPDGHAQMIYSVQASDNSAPFTTTVPCLQVTRSWLIHSGVPALSQPITILDGDPGETFDSGASFVIATDTTAQRIAMEALLSDTSPLLLQAVVTGPAIAQLFPNLTLFPSTTLLPGGGVSSYTTYDWVAIDQVTRDRSGGYVVDPWRRWTLPYRVVDRPAGGVVAQRTWSSLMADDATWSAVLAEFATWNGAFTGTAGS